MFLALKLFWIFSFGIWIFAAGAQGAAALIPNDPLLSQQWYLEKIGAFKAWEVTLGDPSVVVAVIDSGVDIDHPDLKENIWTNPGEIAGDGIDNDGNGFVDDLHGWDFLTNAPDPRPKLGTGEAARFGFHHGTAVAGIIAAVGNNGRGLSGIAPKVKIMALRTLDSEGKGKSSNVIKAVEYAMKQGASVINLSFVSTVQQPLDAPSVDLPFFRVFERARKAGIVVVASAGNEATAEKSEVVDLDARPQVPVCEDPENPFQAVIGVAATDRDDHRGVFSSFGRRCIDLSAPGSEFFVLTAQQGEPSVGVVSESYRGYFRGTSLASPLVSGTAALLKSINPALSADAVQSILQETADPIEQGSVYEGKVGRGRLNAIKALQRVLGASTPLAQSVSGPSDASFVPTPTVARPPVMRKIERREALLLAENAKGRSRIIRAGLGVGSSDREQIAEFSGAITALTQLANGDIAFVRAQKKRATELIVLTQDGALVRSWEPFGPKARETLSLAVGDLDGDGQEEIVVGRGAGGSPEVRVFTLDGALQKKFLAYSKAFRGGVEVAVGDVLPTAGAEIVTVPQSKGPAHVRVFDQDGTTKVQFFASEDRFRSGAGLALLSAESGGLQPIAVGMVQKGRGEVLVFGPDGALQRRFVAFDKIDRQFSLVHRSSGSSIVVAARLKPSLLGLYEPQTLRRLRPIQLSGVESLALAIIFQERLEF